MERIKLSHPGWTRTRPIRSHPIWQKMRMAHAVTSFELEITARCNINCAHCYINLPPGDQNARSKELDLAEIEWIVDEAVAMGAVGCLLTGGEPLLRSDFESVYLKLKKKGLLITLFTNATLITERHVRLFQKYPPNAIEVTVYGATEKTYERVTRKKGSYAAFRKGLEKLHAAGIGVRLKAVALKSNLEEMGEISRFCRERTKDFFRFDPLIHLRYDGNPLRNQEIRGERLSAAEISELERADDERFNILTEDCGRYIASEEMDNPENRLFMCGIGKETFCISPDGVFRPCATLCHPDWLVSLRSGGLYDAWHRLVPELWGLRSDRSEYMAHCGTCQLINLCQWCPARAFLETGQMDMPIEYFCEVTKARADQIVRFRDGIRSSDRMETTAG